MDPDDLYTKVWPDYFEIQRKDLFWYERLWMVLLGRLGPIKNQNRADPSQRGMLLEFGSGPGFLLQLARRIGWSAIGEEPSAVARSYADMLGVTSLANASECFGVPLRYSACISTEVLEHLDDPVAALIRIHGLLMPGGKLALSVPNDNNPLQRLFWGKTKPWIHHTHKQYFTPKSLKAVVEEAGFEVVWQRASFPVELLLVLPIPRKWAWKLSRVWPAPPLLWRFGIGRHCLVIARKR